MPTAYPGPRRLKQTHPGRRVTRLAPLSSTKCPCPRRLGRVNPICAQAVNSLIDKGQPETAVPCSKTAYAAGSCRPGRCADRVAAMLLHLGRPAEAKELWQRTAPPTRAQQLARIATAALAMFDFETALELNRSALDIDPNLTEAWFGVALLHTQRGDATAASAAARTA